MTEKIPSGWQRLRLSDLMSERSEKFTAGDEFEILSVTKEGIVSQSSFFNKQIATEGNIGYKIVRKGDLAISPMNLWMGSVGVLEEPLAGIVSPAYKVFSFESESVSRFMSYMVKSSQMMRLYNLHSRLSLIHI